MRVVHVSQFPGRQSARSQRFSLPDELSAAPRPPVSEKLQQFLTKYVPVTASSPETGEVKCVIRKYVSNAGHVLPEDKRTLVNKFAGPCRTKSFVAALRGTWHSDHVISVPQFGIPQVNVSGLFQACFVGKAPPA